MSRDCPFNEGVVCDSEECYHCGWDPEVAKARRKARMNQKQYRIPFTGYCEVWANSSEEAADKAENIDQQFFAHYEYGEPVCLSKEEDE
jgi:hypothetical protein